MLNRYRLVFLLWLILFVLLAFVKAQNNFSEPDFEDVYYVDIEWNTSIPTRIYIASNSSVYIYNENLESIGQITDENFSSINGLALSPNARFLAISFDDVSDDRVIVWDLLLEQQIANFYMGTTGGKLSWQHNSEQLATTPEGSIRIYNVNTQEVVQEILPLNPTLPVLEIEYSGTSDHIAMLNSFGQLQVWNVLTNEQILNLQNSQYWGLAWSPDGTIVATQNTDNSSIEFWNIQTASLIDTLPTSTELEHPIWSGESNFATYQRRNNITIWNLSTKSVSETIEVDGFIRHIEWMPNTGQMMYFLSQADVLSAIQITSLSSP